MNSQNLSNYCTGSEECGANKILVEEICLAEDVIDISGGDSKFIWTGVFPTDATEKTLFWESSTEDIVTVDQDGYITAHSRGSATIYIYSTDGSDIWTSVEVNVTSGTASVSGITVSPSHVTVKAGECGWFFDAQIEPYDAANTDVIWSSSDSEVAFVSLIGHIIAKKEGTAIICARSAENEELVASATIEVMPGDPPPPPPSSSCSGQGTEEEASTDPDVHKSGNSKVADPVEAYSGAHLLDLNIFQLFEGKKLAVKAHYRSDSLIEGKLGVGWYHDFEKHLVDEQCCIMVYNSPGLYSRYQSYDSMHYTCSKPEKEGFALTYCACCKYPYHLNCNGKRDEYYDANGNLAKVVDHQGYVTEIQYCCDSVIITDKTVNKSIIMELDQTGKISRIRDSAGRAATLEYNDLGHMIRYTDVEGHTLFYTYDEQGRVLTGTDSEGICYFKNVYDAYGRVCEQYDAVGSRPTLFTYEENGVRITRDRNGVESVRTFDANGMLTSFVDGNGNEKRYVYDQHYNIIEEINALGHSKKTYYNSQNLPTQVIDPNGNVTRMEYDERGNLTRIIYPKVAEEEAVESFAYDSANRVIRHTDLRGLITQYTYDSHGLLFSKKEGNRNAITYRYENGCLSFMTDALGAVTRFAYNEYGQMVRKTDPAGGVTLYEYDKCGQLLKTTDANGKITEAVYDGNHRKVAAVDANGTSYTYDGNLKNTAVTLPDGNVIQYTYDGEGNLIATTDQAGNWFLNTYDAAGRLKFKQVSNTAAQLYEYDAADRIVKEKGPNGAEITRTYDANGNVLTETDNDGNVTENAYDARSRLVYTANARSGITRYTYSAAGDLLCETDAAGNKKQYTYDPYGNKLTFTDAKGNVTRYVYDANNRMIESIDAMGNRIAYAYNTLGQLVATTDAKNNVVRYGYDALGRRTTVTDVRGNTFTTVYDAVGNAVAVLDANGNTVSETVYNCLNLPSVARDAQGHSTSYTYNEMGKMATATDAASNVQRYTYDELGRNTAVIDATQKKSSATYDELGNVLSLTGPLGGNTQYAYDMLGRLVSQSTVSGGKLLYTYNDRGLKKEFANARGQKRRYFYDELGRVTGYTCAEDSVTYTYDANGNVLTVTDKNGTVTRTFDALNRVSSYTDTYGKTVGYLYDEVGNLVRITYPDNTAVCYEYDANRNLTKVTDWAGRVTTYTYDKNNRVTGVVKPDGSITATVYDNMQRIVSTCETTPGGVVISGFEYTYDELSRIVEEKVLANSTKLCYTYDKLSRVLTRTVKDLSDTVLSTESYTYDAAGNVKTDPSASNFVYDKQNRLTMYKGKSVKYDLDGNILSVQLGNANMAFAYDSANRLIKAGNSEYTYNAENVRIRNLSGTKDNKYTYDTNRKLSRLLTKTTNGFTTKYVYGLGLIGEERINSFKTYHFDFRGSTVAITGINGNITDTFKYDTYGKQIERTGTSDVIFAYNGRDGVITEPNGLIYMRARYYSPEHRRFINADVVRGEISNAVTLNRYAYANGNPVSNVDPFGLEAQRGPTVLEAAYMADHIYKIFDKEKPELIGGWSFRYLLVDDFGFRMGVYVRVIDESTGELEYTIVNKGTSTLGDWEDNLLQPFGESEDMWGSISIARNFVRNHPNSHITFVGHSKGGAEAAANALATNRDAILFNPATLAASQYWLDVENYSADMTAYIVHDEILNQLFGLISVPIDDVEYLGEPIRYKNMMGPIYNTVEGVKRHQMDYVIELLD